MKINTKKGFSVIEILIAVGIVVLLATIAYTSLDVNRKKSRDAVRQGDLKSLSLAAQRYFSEYFSFPATISDLDQYFAEGAPGSAPKDPSTKNDYGYLVGEYDDASNVTHKYYCFGAKTETSVANTISDTDPQCALTGFAPIEVNYVIKGP